MSKATKAKGKKTEETQKDPQQVYREAADDFAKSSAKAMKSLCTTFGDTQDTFTKELKSICGSEQIKMVHEYLKKTVNAIAAKKSNLKSVK